MQRQPCSARISLARYKIELCRNTVNRGQPKIRNYLTEFRFAFIGATFLAKARREALFLITGFVVSTAVNGMIKQSALDWEQYLEHGTSNHESHANESGLKES